MSPARVSGSLRWLLPAGSNCCPSRAVRGAHPAFSPAILGPSGALSQPRDQPEHLTVSHFKLLRFLQHPGRFFFLQKIQEQCRAADGPQEHPPISGGRKLGSRCPSPPSSSRTVTGPRCPHWSLVQCRSLPYPSQSPYPSASWGQRPNKLLACRETQTNSCVGATATEKARKQ